MIRAGVSANGFRCAPQLRFFRQTPVRLSAPKESMSSHFFEGMGNIVLRVGVGAPLIGFGVNKFSTYGVEEIKLYINACPWLSWMYPTFGEKLTAELIGYVEVVAGALVLLSLFSPQAGIIGGVLATATNAVTCTTMAAVPILDTDKRYLNPTGQVLIKDIALLGGSLIVLGSGLRGMRR